MCPHLLSTFPLDLPTWFIKLFTKECDVVLDPFLGSGTSAVAAAMLDRGYVGIEIDPEFVQISRSRLHEVTRPNLFTVCERGVPYLPGK